jgi:protein TonB
MATALQRAAEATGRSEAEPPVASKIPDAPAAVSDAPTNRAFATSTSSGHAAAVAPARIPQKAVEQPVAPPVDVPTFSSLGDTSSEPAERSKKPILITAAILVAGVVGYVGWTKMQSAPATQNQTAPIQTAPVRAQQPIPSAPASTSPGPGTTSAPVTSQPSAIASPLPVERTPDITLSTAETHPSAAKKTTSIVASNTVVRNPVEVKPPEPEPIVVKNEVAKPAPVPVAAEEPAQPPALGSFDTASNNQNTALSGIVSNTPVNLPKPAQKVKVSQGVSQGLLIKSVPPEYPQQAMKMHIQGAVELLAYIGKDGSITGVKPIKGDANLARAAVEAVKQWKYKPYYLNDQPVEIQTQITVNFKLP